MKKGLLILTLAAVMFTVCSCAKKEEPKDLFTEIQNRGKLIVGVKFDTKPFGYLEKDNTPAGFDIDLARRAAKYILNDENKVEFVPVTPSNRIMKLNSGEVDMVIATMSITPARNRIVEFSKPYYVAGQALMTAKDSNITSLSELNGEKVIVIFGSTAEKNIRKASPEAVVLGYKTYIEGYNALKSKKALVMTSDDTILMGFAMNDKDVKLMPKRYSQEPYAIALRKDGSGEKVLNRINLMLDDMIKSGELSQIKSKWIKY